MQDKTVLVIGQGSGIARAIAQAVGEDGGRVAAAGPHPDDLAEAYRGTDIGIEHVDVTDEPSIAALYVLFCNLIPAPAFLCSLLPYLVGGWLVLVLGLAVAAAMPQLRRRVSEGLARS